MLHFFVSSLWLCLLLLALFGHFKYCGKVHELCSDSVSIPCPKVQHLAVMQNPSHQGEGLEGTARELVMVAVCGEHAQVLSFTTVQFVNCGVPCALCGFRTSYRFLPQSY